MNNINYAFKPEEISEIKPYYDQALNSNTINLDMQTTDLSSSHMKKHRKKYPIVYHDLMLSKMKAITSQLLLISQMK